MSRLCESDALFAGALTLVIPVSGMLAIPALRAGYAIDYASANEIYITVATPHVIAELPFMF